MWFPLLNTIKNFLYFQQQFNFWHVVSIGYMESNIMELRDGIYFQLIQESFRIATLTHNNNYIIKLCNEEHSKGENNGVLFILKQIASF